MARKEKELHLQLYPGWSARDNYATHTKKKKRKKEMPSSDDIQGDCTTNAKKCRARYGMEQQKNWCKPCRRKKKCIRVLEDGGTDGEDGDISDSQMGDDSDSMLGSPAPSSASDDPFSTPSKRNRLHGGVESPLVHNSSREFSDMDVTLKSTPSAADVILPTHQSPFSAYRYPDRDRLRADQYLSTRFNFMPASSPTSVGSRSSSLNRSYSIESLAKSSVNSDTREKDVGDHNRSFDYQLSPLSSPGDLSYTNSPKFNMSSFAEDINKNLSPKKQGVSNNFSISSLSVSAVTPSRVHCS